MNFKLKMACTATLLALGVSAHASGAIGKTTIDAPTSDQENQRVIVKFKPGQAVQAKSMALKAGGKMKVNLKQHNAFAVEVSPQALRALQNNPNVEYVEPDVKRKLLSTNLNLTELEPWGISQVEGDIVSDSNAGNRTVCIIDSGYAINHSDLNSNNHTGQNDPGGSGNWYESGGSHGTHVAGTMAAVSNGSGVVGVMPNGNVNLHIVKIFDESGLAYSSTLTAAADECADAGANVISMSLGGGPYSTTENNAFQGHLENGILNVAAAGNDANASHSYPASYDSVVSVAATDENNQHAYFSQYTNQVELSGPGVAVLSSVDGDGSLGQLEVNGVDYFEDGVVPPNFFNSSLDSEPSGIAGSASGTLDSCSSSSCPDMTGNICVIERRDLEDGSGSTTKARYPEFNAVEACVDAGAEGIVVYSRSERPSLEIPYLVDFNGKIEGIPVVTVNRATGLDLVSKEGQNATISVATGQDWSYYNGTSMATPHVSGVAALVWSYHPSCTAKEIRQVLADTAEDLDTAGRDNRTGYGLVKAQAALDHLNTNGCSGDIEPPPSGNELEKGVAKTNLSGAQRSEVFYTIEVPAGATDLNFDISGGSGDADLYVQYGSAPTTSNYDCRPWKNGNTESCEFASPQAGTYHVMIRGYSAYSGLSLVADYIGGGNPDDTLSESNLSGASGSTQYFTLEVPAGRSSVSIEMSGGSGDADLYVRFGSQPTTSNYDCRPYKYGNNEACTLNAREGTYHIMIRGYNSYSGISLEGSSN